MKTYTLLALAVIFSSLSSCASNTPAGQTMNGVNQVGHVARSVQAIQSFF